MDTVLVIAVLFLLCIVGVTYGGLLLERREGAPLALSPAMIYWAAAILGSYLLYVFL
jgi:hypothetical protein